MAHFNDADRRATSTSGGYTPRLNRTPVHERVDIGVPETFTDDRSVGRQQDYTSGSGTSTRPEGSPRSTSQGALNGWARAQGYFRMVSATHYWPMIGQRYVGPDSSRMISRESSADSTAASGDLATTPTPSSHLLDDRRDYEYRLPTRTFIWDAPTPYRPTTGPSRTGTSRTQRYLPYDVPCVYSNEHADAKAGQSNREPPRTPPVATSHTNPPRMSPGVAAGTETVQEIKEEADALAQCSASASPPKWRSRYQEGTKRLSLWAQKWKNRERRPSPQEALSIALKAIQEHHQTPVYPVPRLRKGPSTNVRSPNVRKRTAAGEAKKRAKMRELNEELSRYFEPPGHRTEWECPRLLSRVLHFVESLEMPSA